jgi:glyoxylase-like metal-dependent hydrolase (beta-lactamase superfamily II)
MASTQISLSRRRLLAGVGGTAAAAVIGGTSMAPARAKAPMQNTQAPAFYRFKLGAIEATVVSDGPLSMGEPKPDVFVGLSKDEFGKALSDNFLPTDNVVLEQNALVVNTGDRVALFDTGMGTSKMLGPDTGRLIANLKAAGLAAGDIDAIVLTHAHPDHCFGLMSDDGARLFPNAQIYMAQADLEFWTDEGKLSNEMLKGFVAGARQQLLPNRDRIVFVKDGEEFLPGVAVQRRRHRAPPRDRDGAAAPRIHLRHRRQASGREPATSLRHARGAAHPVRHLPLHLARPRLSRQARRSVPLLPGADADDAMS